MRDYSFGKVWQKNRHDDQSVYRTESRTVPHYLLISHIQSLMILRENYEIYAPDYIWLDNRDGQNPNNFAGIKDLSALQLKLATDPNYELVERQDKAFLYRRRQ